MRKNVFTLLMVLLMIIMTCGNLLGEKNATEGTPAVERMESWRQHVRMAEESPFNGLLWRSLGPSFLGGRVESIDAIPGSDTIIVGFGAGNLWRTDNSGLTWKAIFEHQSTFSIGDVEISDSHPNIIWVGSGENLLARSSFAGTGVFKSEDGGASWKNMGLSESHHIGRVAVHPEDPDIVYVAALGHEYSANPERGLFKTSDGGRSWSRCLYVSDRVGVVDVILEPGNPSTVYAATLKHSRKAWMNSGTGVENGIHKSTDGGKTWKRLSGGLPDGLHIGRIALDVSPSNPRVVYAFIVNQTPTTVKGKEGDETVRPGPEVYRSQDGGDSWQKQTMKNEKFAVHSYGDIRVSPDNPDEIYVLGVNLLHSEDGGEQFEQLEGRIIHLYHHPSRALHLDQHELWIDPENTDRLILGNDGGVYISRDRGENWLHLNNISAGEFYAVSVDNAEPYNIYGGTQDNAAVFGPGDRYPEDGIEDPWQAVWIDLWGGGDSYVTLSDPSDVNTIYFEQQFGNFQRKDMKTGRIKRIRPRLKEEPPLRYNWMSPFIVSRHNPLTLYFGANKLFKSLNRGDSWICISPDLSSKPGKDRQGNVPYGTITTISESPLRPGLIYVGTDDGRVWVTQNDGVQWKPIHRGLPDKWISRVEASSTEAGTVYVSLTGYREDDFKSYLFKSGTNGSNWQSISSGLPAQQFNVIREDPADADILYAASDQGGIFVSLNRGRAWQSLCAGMPTVAVHDIAIQAREREMVAASHGRSIFKLDLNPLHEYKRTIKDQNLALFAIKPARLPKSRDYRGDWAYETGKKATVYYYLKEKTPVIVSIFDGKGKVVKVFNRSGQAGVNRLVWNLAPEKQPIRKGVYETAFQLVRPGKYLLKIEAGGSTLEGNISVVENR